MTLTLRDLAFLGAGVPSVPWTPAQLSSVLRVWLDADDASTITLNGSNVSQWRDKSGLGNHYSQVVSSFQMAYMTNRVNGRAAVEADTAGEYMDGAAGTAMNGSGMSTFVVAQQSATPNFLSRILFRNNSIWVGDWFINYTGNFAQNTMSAVFGDGTTWTLRGSTDTLFGTSTHILGATVDAGGSAITYPDGNTGPTIAMGWANFTGSVDLGHAGGGSQMFFGPICEVLMMINVLGTSDRQKLEGYLAHKWQGAGASNSLPSGHPYKSTAPTV